MCEPCSRGSQAGATAGDQTMTATRISAEVRSCRTHYRCCCTPDVMHKTKTSAAHHGRRHPVRVAGIRLRRRLCAQEGELQRAANGDGAGHRAIPGPQYHLRPPHTSGASGIPFLVRCVSTELCWRCE